MLSSGFRAILRRSGRVLARSKRFEQSKNLFLSNDLIFALAAASTSESTDAEGPAPVLRPDLDFDFLLDDKNTDLIQQNIRYGFLNYDLLEVHSWYQ